jgi:hypothetical protein
MSEVVVPLRDILPLIEEKLAAGGEAVITVKGSSMNPFYVDGKTAVTLAKPKADPKRLDVVLYETETGNHVLHRIVGVRGEFLLIEGDGLRRRECVHRRKVIAAVTTYRNGAKTTGENDPRHRFRVRLWLLLRPFRHVLLALWRRTRRPADG